MNVQSFPVDSITPYQRNAKTHPKEQVERIARQIHEVGFLVPIVVDKDMVVVSGHGRLLAARSLGLKEVPVIVAEHLSEDQAMAWRIADNKVAESPFEEQLLAFDLKTLESHAIDLALTGFSDIEAKELLAKFDMVDPEVTPSGSGTGDNDEVIEPKEIARVRPGELWTLGRHRLLCGDATKREDVERLIAGEKADMVFTDPPYGVNYEGGHNKKKRAGIKGDRKEGHELTDIFADSLALACELSHDHAAFYIWYASTKAIDIFGSFAKLPLTVRAVICWYKVRSGLGAFMSQYIPNYEPCIYAFKTGFSPQWFGPTDEKTVWELQKERQNDYHPTQKPVELPMRAMRNSSKTRDLVLDLFGGSGSTIIAAESLDRRAALMELDPHYCDVILERWARHTGQDPVREDGVTWSAVKAQPAPLDEEMQK